MASEPPRFLVCPPQTSETFTAQAAAAHLCLRVTVADWAQGAGIVAGRVQGVRLPGVDGHHYPLIHQRLILRQAPDAQQTREVLGMNALKKASTLSIVA